MTLGTMRLVDRTLGLVACCLLTLWRCLVAGKTGPARSGGKTLFLKLAEQGASVPAISAVQHVVDRVGRANVYLLVFEENRFIWDQLDLVPLRNIVAIPSGTLSRVLLGAVRAILELREARIDVTIDLEFFSRATAAIAYLSGARTRIGLHPYGGVGPWRGDLLTHRVPLSPRLHVGQVFETLVRALDVPADRLPAFPTTTPERPRSYPRFRPDPRELEALVQRVRDRFGGRLPEFLLVLHPNPADILPLRRWPLERYQELARRLLERHPEMAIVLTGMAGERGALERMATSLESGRCVCLAGQTSLRELLVLLSVADVLVTNDCGPSHFSALTGVDSVTLFGPESPEIFGNGSPRNTALWSRPPCSPCLSALNDRRSACRDNVCLQRISVEEVEDAVVGVWEARRSRLAPGGKLP